MFQSIGQIPDYTQGIDAALQQNAAMKPKGGMFGGGKFGLKEAIAFGLAGLISRRNPVPLQMLMGAMQGKQEAEAAEDQYQRRRNDDMQDWMAKEQWKAEHSGPPDIAQKVAYLNSLKPGLGDTYATNYAQSGGSIFGRMFTDPATGQVYSLGGGGMPQIGSVVDDPRAMDGGPTPQASGGFPRPY